MAVPSAEGTPNVVVFSFSASATCRISLRCPTGILGVIISLLSMSDRASKLSNPRVRSLSIAG